MNLSTTPHWKGSMTPATQEEREVEVARCVFSVLQEYMNHTHYPDEINTGGCGGFAVDVYRAIPDEHEPVVLQDPDRMHIFVFVSSTGLCYDSEAIYGVDGPSNLPIYRRTGIAVDLNDCQTPEL